MHRPCRHNELYAFYTEKATWWENKLWEKWGAPAPPPHPRWIRHCPHVPSCSNLSKGHNGFQSVVEL